MGQDDRWVQLRHGVLGGGRLGFLPTTPSQHEVFGGHGELLETGENSFSRLFSPLSVVFAFVSAGLFNFFISFVCCLVGMCGGGFFCVCVQCVDNQREVTALIHSQSYRLFRIVLLNESHLPATTCTLFQIYI